MNFVFNINITNNGMKKIIFALLLGASQALIAMPCFVTLVKDSCWLSYNVTIEVLQADTNKKISQFVIPQGTAWGRQSFDCKPGDTLKFSSSFYPVFWKNDENKVYLSQSNWQLPTSGGNKNQGVALQLCFSKDFIEVPFPPTGTSTCVCKTDDIPPVSLDKK